MNDCGHTKDAQGRCVVCAMEAIMLEGLRRFFERVLARIDDTKNAGQGDA